MDAVVLVVSVWEVDVLVDNMNVMAVLMVVVLAGFLA